LTVAGKTKKGGSGAWTEARRQQQAERARKQHASGTFGRGRRRPTAARANESTIAALQKIVKSPKSSSGEVMRAAKELRLQGVTVPEAGDDIDDLIVDAIEREVYSILAVGLSLGGPVRDRVRAWAGDEFTDEDEQEILDHVKMVTDSIDLHPSTFAQMPLAKMLRSNFPPIEVVAELKVGGAIRRVLVSQAAEVESTGGHE
jgi:hypothetical protein